MDSLITAAARALAIGDPLGALKRVGLREDPPALALRGTAMAQLGDLARARVLLRKAARGYGVREAVFRARCIIAEAEVALASRDLLWQPKALSAARATLEQHGDRLNAAFARYIDIRRLLLIGRLLQAEQALSALDSQALPPPLRAAHELIRAGIAVRRVQASVARRALICAERAARQAAIPALIAEVDAASRALVTPVARLLAQGTQRALALAQVEALFASAALIIDACRFSVRQAGAAVGLARRPVLFTLARMLGEAWPADVPREALMARAFRAKRADDSHRARLRVEIGRLRSVLRQLARVVATERGFALLPHRAHKVVVLSPPVEERHAAVLALLADGEPWSSSALALALAESARTVQRALESLAAAGKVQALGRGRARRWMTPPLPGLAPALLLPAVLPGDLG